MALHAKEGPVQALGLAAQSRGTHLTNRFRDSLIRCSLMISLLESQQDTSFLKHAQGWELVPLLLWTQVLPSGQPTGRLEHA